MRIEELLTRFGLLWLDGTVVILAAALQAGPFLLAGGGLAGLLGVVTGRPQARPTKEQTQTQAPAGFTLR